MTYRQSDLTLPVEFLEEIAAQGFDALPELIRTVTPALAVRRKCERDDADGASEVSRRCTLRTIVKATGPCGS
jgi:hypothetical protein